MTVLDDADRQLISLLRDDGRMPVAALAKQLRLSRNTVQARLARLQADGVIVGYTVRLKPMVAAHRIRALMLVKAQSNKTPAVIRALRGHPSVVTIHTTNGSWDVVAEVQADTLEQFDMLLSAVRAMDGISVTETSILLTTHKL